MAITAVHLSFKSPFLKCLSRTLNLSPIVEVSKPWSSCMTWKRKNGEKITFLNNFHPIPQFSVLHKGQKNKEILLCFCKRRDVLWDEVRQKFHYLNVKIQIWWQMKKKSLQHKLFKDELSLHGKNFKINECWCLMGIASFCLSHFGFCCKATSSSSTSSIFKLLSNSY